MATWDMYEKTEYNALQYATLKYGRDSLIAHLVRDERKIARVTSWALRRCGTTRTASAPPSRQKRWPPFADSFETGHCQHSVEPQEKIVDFAFFGKDAPERKANKAVEDESVEDEEEESEEEDEV